MNENVMVMSQEERDAMFVDAGKHKQTEKEDLERQKIGGGGYEQAVYGPLYLNTFSSFRFLGNPAENRLGDSKSPKIVTYSMITGDDDKRFRCVWPGMPTIEGSKTWILAKIFNKVLAYD